MNDVFEFLIAFWNFDGEKYMIIYSCNLFCPFVLTGKRISSSREENCENIIINKAAETIEC